MTRWAARPLLLDLFAGAGGASMGYHRAGFDVVGVDIEPQDDYPFPMHIGDALEVMSWLLTREQHVEFRDDLPGPLFLGLRDFDVIAASPPCPRYSTISPDASRDQHPDLIPVIRDLLKPWAERTGGLYVIENVEGAARVMDHPVKVCGSYFGLSVRRHRYFETNAPFVVPTECLHRSQGRPIGVYGDHPQYDEHYRRPDGTRRGNKAKTHAEASEALGIDWMTDWDDLTDAIPPAYTEYLGVQLLDRLREVA